MKKKKHIAIVANWDWVLYNFRLPLSRTLIAEGLDVHLICPPGEYFTKMQELGFQLIPWNLNRRSINPFSELKSIFALHSLYKKNNFSAVHHFTIKPILYGTIAARLTRISKIINNFTGLGFLFSSSLKAQILRIFILPLYRFTLRSKNNHSIFQNPSVLSELARRNIISGEQAYIVPGTGVDPSRFVKSAERKRSGDPTVLMAARLLYDKGVKEYVEVAQRIRKSNPKVVFLLAGKPDYGNPAAIPEKQLAVWKKEGWVHFLGHRSDIPSLLLESDIAVLPSYHEGTPLFLLEAAAASLPIVATDIEGVKMIVEDGINGYLVPVGDTYKLAQSIQKLLDNPKLREKMGKVNRQIATEKFDINIINQQYVTIYQQLGILSI